MYQFRDLRYTFEPPTLAMPSGTLYPFDRDFITLWNACQRAGWQVDDWVFTFYMYGGAKKILHLSSIEGTIEGAPFLLRTDRSTDLPSVGGHNVVSNLSQIYMPRENNLPAFGLEVYEDLSMSAYLCVDPMWNSRTASDFYHKFKMHARMNGDTRSYLKYKPELNSNDNDGHPISLVYDDDLGRDYEPQSPNEPLVYRTQDVYSRARDFIRRLLARAQRAPSSEVDIAAAAMPQPEKVPEGLELNTLLSHRTVGRGTGFENWRLSPFDVPQTPDDPFPVRARDGFTCAVAAPLSLPDLDWPFLRRDSDAVLVARVRPKVANDIFVIDVEGARLYREVLWDDHPKLTDDEANKVNQMAARTMVPLSEYKNNYVKPVYLIGRDLDRSEYEIRHKVAPLTREDRSAIAE